MQMEFVLTLTGHDRVGIVKEITNVLVRHGGNVENSRMARLGDKLIVSLSAVDVTHGSMLSNQRMSVDRIEDLEAVATRMAEAIVEGRSVEDTAALGTITAAEVAPDRRREGHSGPSLRVGGMVPFGDSLHAGFGVLFDLGYWYEARDFAIEPRVAFRMSTDVDGEEYYRVGHLDVAAHYILTRTDFAPFIGLGGGLRFADEVRNRQVSIGKAVRLVGTEQVEKSAWGPGAYARLGVLLFRTYTLRVAFTVDYDVTFVELHDDKVPQSIQAGVGVMF